MIRHRIILPLLASVYAVTALSKPFDAIIALGDNLVDTGEGAWIVTGGTFPPESSGYYQHRFTNGKTWVENLAQMLALPVKSFGIGGATTINDLKLRGVTGRLGGRVFAVPSLLEQVKIVTNSLSPSAASRTLWVLSAGINDAYKSTPASPGGAVTNVMEAVSQIRAMGGTKFLICTVPIRGVRAPGIPSVSTPEAERLHTFGLGFTTGLTIRLKYERSGIAVVDLFDIIQQIETSASKYGLDPTKFADSCLTGVYSRVKGVTGGTVACTSSDKYIWWDDFNPTARVHQMFASVPQKAILDKGWYA